MQLNFPVETTVRARRSVRTYDRGPLSQNEKDLINAYIAGLSNPFSRDVHFKLLEKTTSGANEKLGTYGVIKGAVDFIGASVAGGELSLEALGYSFETLVLYLTSLGLGSCWLGGTFNRSGFDAAMELREGELFPVICPVGHPGEKTRIVDSLFRKGAKSDQRKAWPELFFKGDFSQPLSKDEAGAYAFPLEILRLAPSAANGQPWRLVKDGGAYHFYEAKSRREHKAGIDLQRVDLGIAACHFHLSAMERDLPGKFEKQAAPDLQTPDHFHYLFSWVME